MTPEDVSEALELRAEPPFTIAPAYWLPEPSTSVDCHAAFRSLVHLPQSTEVELRGLASGSFWTSIDGDPLQEGPHRYDLAHPEFCRTVVSLAAGTHVVAVHVQHNGLATHTLPDMPPFMWCDLVAEVPIIVDWKCRRLDAYKSAVRRINPNLGWIEWCDTRLLPGGWPALVSDDEGWAPAQVVLPGIGDVRAPSTGEVRSVPLPMRPTAEGEFVERFETFDDDPPTAAHLRDLHPDGSVGPSGSWFRFDLGTIQLGRPRVELDLPAGLAVDLLYGESLIDGRVAPFISFSNGPSANMDHYLARGGRQTFGPLSPRGMRFMEVHVSAPPTTVRLVDAGFASRQYFGQPVGAFSCDDGVLNQVWRTSVTTLESCCEDALTDCPTRERGQWLGDSAGPGVEVLAVAHSDLRLVARSLRQAAWCATDDGLVAGLYPGRPLHLTTYAAMWASGVLRYAQLSGDRELLRELYQYADRNMRCLRQRRAADMDDDLMWPFVDWGYRVAGRDDAVLQLIVAEGARATARWGALLGEDDAARHEDFAMVLVGSAREQLPSAWGGGTDPSAWCRLGFHATVLSLRAGLVDGSHQGAAVEAMKEHILASFPNTPGAPRIDRADRLASPSITPWFLHFALPELIERGEMDFVLDQYRSCWGWMLDQGLTTWAENFDLRWSHCHQWSGAPAWQMSRYLLGLHPCFLDGTNRFDLRLITGSLESATGRVPLLGEGFAEVEWVRTNSVSVVWKVQVTDPVSLRTPNGDVIQVVDKWQTTINGQAKGG